MPRVRRKAILRAQEKPDVETITNEWELFEIMFDGVLTTPGHEVIARYTPEEMKRAAEIHDAIVERRRGMANA